MDIIRVFSFLFLLFISQSCSVFIDEEADTGAKQASITILKKPIKKSLLTKISKPRYNNDNRLQTCEFSYQNGNLIHIQKIDKDDYDSYQYLPENSFRYKEGMSELDFYVLGCRKTDVFFSYKGDELIALENNKKQLSALQLIELNSEISIGSNKFGGLKLEYDRRDELKKVHDVFNENKQGGFKLPFFQNKKDISSFKFQEIEDGFFFSTDYTKTYNPYKNYEKKKQYSFNKYNDILTETFKESNTEDGSEISTTYTYKIYKTSGQKLDNPIEGISLFSLFMDMTVDNIPYHTNFEKRHFVLLKALGDLHQNMEIDLKVDQNGKIIDERTLKISYSKNRWINSGEISLTELSLKAGTKIESKSRVRADYHKSEEPHEECTRYFLKYEDFPIN